MYGCVFICMYLYKWIDRALRVDEGSKVAGPPKRSQCLACGCLKPTFGRHAPKTVKSDVVRLPDGLKTAESDASLWPDAFKMIDSRIDFRHFSRCRGMGGWSGSATCRTSVFTGRGSTFEDSQTLRTNEKTIKFCDRSLRR